MPPRAALRASGGLLRRTAPTGRPCAVRGSSRASSSAAAAKPGLTPEAATAALVRTSDHPAHLAAAFYPAALRPHYLALRAFNVETATIKDNVSNETLGRIRVGWWRDAVRGAFDNKPSPHPTLEALRAAIHDPAVLRGGGLVEDHFLRIVDAREEDVAAPSVPPLLADIEMYAERTSSRLLYLSLNLAALSAPELDEIFSHLGKAIGLSTLLASLPHSAGFTAQSQAPIPQSGRASRSALSTQRRLALPREYAHAHGVVEEEVYRLGPQAPGLTDAVFDTATRANDYLISARTAIAQLDGGKLPELALGPLMNAIQARHYLTRLEAAQFNVFGASMQLHAQGRGWRLPWEMVRAKWRRSV